MKPTRLWIGAMLLAVTTGASAWGQEPCPEPGCRTSWRVEDVTEDVKVPQFNTKDDVHVETQPFFELQEHTETRTCVETVLKPRTIVRECVESTFKPEAVTDPVTGCRKYVLKPVQEVKAFRTVVYDACPEERSYKITTYTLKPVTREVQVKRLQLECKPEERTITHGVLLPSVCVDRDVQMTPPCDPKAKPLPAKP